jgi:YtkA-like
VAEEDVTRAAIGAWVVAGACSIAPALAFADDCAAALEAAQPLVADGDGARIVFVPRPAPAPVGRHFDVDFVVCAGAAALDATKIQVDADMPAHRHGMNYRAAVSALGPGVYRAQGLMFHMPGRWRLIFDVALDGRSLRLTRELEVQ